MHNLLIEFRTAAASGNLEETKRTLQEMINKGYNVNSQYYPDDEYNLTGSAKSGHLHIVKYLVSQGVHIHTEYEESIRVAAYHKQYDIIAFLLDNDDNIDQSVVLNDPVIENSVKQFIEKWNLKKLLEHTTTNDIKDKKIKV